MTKVLGEVFMATSRPTDYDGTPLTPDDGVSMKLYVDDPAGTRVVDGEDMTYDADLSFTDGGVTRVGWWYYEWDTALLTIDGTYKGKPVVIGVAGVSKDLSFNWRLAKDDMVIA